MDAEMATHPLARGHWQRLQGREVTGGRDGAGLLTLGDDLYLLGGWNTAWSPKVRSEVWRSQNHGRVWERLPDAPWAGRHSAGWASGREKLFVVGGDTQLGAYQKDVWRATPTRTGVEWACTNSNAEPFRTGRVLHQTWYIEEINRLIIVGGQTVDDDLAENKKANKPGSPFYADVWWSDNDGASWSKVADNCEWAPRCSIIGSPYKDGNIWLVGGGIYPTGAYERQSFNDVWRSPDFGVTWFEVTSSAAFPARHYNAVAVRGNELIMLAGYDTANRNDVWASSNGAVWREIANTPWAIRHALGAAVHEDEVVILGGPLDDTSTWGVC